MVVLADDASPVPLFSQLHCNTAAQLQHIKLNCTTAAATQLLLLHNSDQLQKKPIGRQPETTSCLSPLQEQVLPAAAGDCIVPY